ncbi:MAG TPA: hypothetical protein VHW72_17500 [Candidatus Angelobacter sp.]|nr:hypothetical protein [Candidatus Angelobacter sp.]
MLADAAHLLEPLLAELVFVGGGTTALFITDQAAAAVRTSYDVDAIAAINSYAAYVEFSERLRDIGFTEDDSPGAPVCRWRCQRIIFDLMSLDEKILGFSNRWYRAAMDTAQEHILANGLRIRAVTAVYFCATKLEAFAGRGGQDYLASHDLEDLVSVLDGRPEIIQEIVLAPHDVRAYITAEINKLLATPQFLDALPGYLLPDQASQARLPNLMVRLKDVAALA